MGFVGQQQLQVLLDGGRGVEAAAGLQFFRQRAPAELQDRLQLGKLGGAKAIDLAEFLERGGKQAVQRAEMAGHFASQVDRAFAGGADSQEYRQQFRIGKRLRAEFDQTFARPLICGPVGNCHGVIEVRSVSATSYGPRWLTISSSDWQLFFC